MVDTPQVAAELTMAMSRLRARLRLESSAPVRSWTWSQLSTLRRIIEHGPTTAAALAQAEHVRPQSIAETIAALKADGLVATAPDPTDGRKSLLTATTRGHEVADSVIAQREEWLTQALDAVATPAERELLAKATTILTKLADCQLTAADQPQLPSGAAPAAEGGASSDAGETAVGEPQLRLGAASATDGGVPVGIERVPAARDSAGRPTKATADGDGSSAGGGTGVAGEAAGTGRIGR
jgi:DNA-binding MarR family transcriptional regulator